MRVSDTLSALTSDATTSREKVGHVVRLATPLAAGWPLLWLALGLALQALVNPTRLSFDKDILILELMGAALLATAGAMNGVAIGALLWIGGDRMRTRIVRASMPILGAVGALPSSFVLASFQGSHDDTPFWLFMAWAAIFGALSGLVLSVVAMRQRAARSRPTR